MLLRLVFLLSIVLTSPAALAGKYAPSKHMLAEPYEEGTLVTKDTAQAETLRLE